MRNKHLHKSCDGCLWSDVCKSDERCEGFEPLDTYSIIKGEYEHDLHERVKAYEEIIREFE